MNSGQEQTKKKPVKVFNRETLEQEFEYPYVISETVPSQKV